MVIVNTLPMYVRPQYLSYNESYSILDHNSNWIYLIYSLSFHYITLDS